MKKIGILYGQENSFPPAVIERINSKNITGILAEAVSVDKVVQGTPMDYAVIVDRISHDVPFYRGMLKNAAICGTAVLNNPFWNSADEKFFNNCLATKVGVPVPKTVLLPSNVHPPDTNANSFRNLKMPLDWEGIFKYIGFPAYMKPFSGGGWKNVYKCTDAADFYTKHQETGQLVMLLQEEITFDHYFRCYCIGGNQVKIMRYEPRNPHHLRYVVEGPMADQRMYDIVHEYTLKLCNALGYDINTVEFAIRDGIPYAIDFCNPVPDANLESVGQENFDWVINAVTSMCIEKALGHKEGADNLTWGSYIKNASHGNIISKQSMDAVVESMMAK